MSKSVKLHEKLGYTSSNNPFGDSKLGKKFVWKKRDEVRKNEHRGEGGEKSVLDEIEKVRERRLARERMQREREEAKELEMRRREAEQFDNWEEKEEEFHRKQMKLRSKIRIKSGRGEPIDFLAKNILILDDSDDELENETPETREPREILQYLSQSELLQVTQDANVYKELEKECGGEWLDYWREVGRLCSSLAEKKKDKEIHPAVAKDVEKFLHDKSLQELDGILRQVKRKRRREPDAEDITYWTAVENQALAARANARLYEIHRKILTRQSKLFSSQSQKNNLPNHKQLNVLDSGASQEFTTQVQRTQRKLAHFDQSQAAIDMEARERSKGLNEGEEFFHVEVSPCTPPWLASQRHITLIKPRYLNKIKTGFEWNKYNQTHYTAEEPPPKMVQGYIFNIFYPQLLDPSIPPTFVLEQAPPDDAPSQNSAANEFLIIRFRAGPPYEEIAFKIINMEWDRNSKHGYNCVFEHGVLQLHFNFSAGAIGVKLL